MLRDYEYEFMMALHGKLKERINSGVLVKVMNGDVLFIRLRDSEHDWYMTYPNLSQKIFDGWSTDEATNDIVNKYRKDVLRRYFKC